MELPIEMYQSYVLRRGQDCDSLENALQSSDVTVFKKIGHQLKGNAASFGFSELVQLAHKMEAMNSEKLPKEGHSLIEELRTWVRAKKQEFGEIK